MPVRDWCMERQQDYVMRTVEERGIRFIQLWFTDVLGVPKAFAITPAELENALEEGMTFDGSAIDGFSRVQESDVLAKPDPRTFQILPLRHDPAVARMFCAAPWNGPAGRDSPSTPRPNSSGSTSRTPTHSRPAVLDRSTAAPISSS